MTGQLFTKFCSKKFVFLCKSNSRHSAPLERKVKVRRDFAKHTPIKKRITHRTWRHWKTLNNSTLLAPEDAEWNKLSWKLWYVKTNGPFLKIEENYVAYGIASLDQGLRARKKTRPQFITSDFINFVGNVLLWNPCITSEHTSLSKFGYFWFYARLILLTFSQRISYAKVKILCIKVALSSIHHKDKLTLIIK